MRLIDADALCLGKFVEPRTEWHQGWNDALDAATTQAPTIDAVPVVRCKDCCHKHIVTCEGMIGCMYKGKLIQMKPTDYCSYGERI